MSESLTSPEFSDENPLPPEDDPIVSMVEKPIEQMSDDELSAYIDEVQSAANNPKEFNRRLTGRTKKVKKPSKTSKENLMLDDILGGL